MYSLCKKKGGYEKCTHFFHILHIDIKAGFNVIIGVG